MRALKLLILLIFPLALNAEGFFTLDSTSTQVTGFKTLGLYSDVSPFAAGLTQQFNFDQGEREQLRFTAALGATYNPVDDSRYSQLFDVTATAGVGWVYNPTGAFSVTPQVGAGVIVHTLYGDMDKYDHESFFLFADQFYRLGVQLAMNLTSKSGENVWSLIMTPECALFPEQDQVGILAGASLGVQRNF